MTSTPDPKSNRLNTESHHLINTLFKERDPALTISHYWKAFLQTSEQSVTYQGFYSIWKDLLNPPQVVRKNRGSVRTKVEAFCEDTSFPNKAAAWEEFVKKTGCKISYVYFAALTKSLDISVSNRRPRKPNTNRDITRTTKKDTLKPQPEKLVAPEQISAETGLIKPQAKKASKKDFVTPKNVHEIQQHWGAFIRKNVTKVLAKFNNKDYDKIRDLEQEVYVELCLYFKPEKYDVNKGTFTTYLYYIIRNCVYRYMKNTKRDPLSEKNSVSLNETVSEDSDCEFGDMFSLNSSVLSATTDQSYAFQDSQLDTKMFTASINGACNSLDNRNVGASCFFANQGTSEAVSVSYTGTAPSPAMTYSSLFSFIERDFTSAEIHEETGVPLERIASAKKTLRNTIRTINTTCDNLLNV